MAAIDKIYCNKQQALDIIDYLESLDNDFKDFFINAHSIKDYLYRKKEDAENISEEDAGKEFPISNFPREVEKWLYQREDCLPFIKNYILMEQYGGSEEELISPLYKEKIVQPAKKVKVIDRKGFFTYSNSPLTSFYVSQVYQIREDGTKESFWYHDDLDRWASAFSSDDASLVSGGWISSMYHGKAGRYSLKAMIRKIFKWKLPPNTYVVIEDWRLMHSITCKLT